MTLRVAAISAGLALPAFMAMGETNPRMDSKNLTVTGISINDSRDLDHASFLAVTWQRQHEFARAKG